MDLDNVKNYIRSYKDLSFSEKIKKFYIDSFKLYLTLNLLFLSIFINNYKIVFLTFLFCYSVLMVFPLITFLLQKVMLFAWLYIFSGLCLFCLTLSNTGGRSFLGLFLNQKKIEKFQTYFTISFFFKLWFLVILLICFDEITRSLISEANFQMIKEETLPWEENYTKEV